MMSTARLVSSFAICVALGISAASADDGKVQFEHVMNIGSAGTGEGQFKYLEDFAFTKGGQLLATDAVHAWVQVFDKASGKFISRFGGKGLNVTIPDARVWQDSDARICPACAALSIRFTRWTAGPPAS